MGRKLGCKLSSAGCVGIIGQSRCYSMLRKSAKQFTERSRISNNLKRDDDSIRIASRFSRVFAVAATVGTLTAPFATQSA